MTDINQYPDENKIKHMAEYVAQYTFRHLVHTTGIDRVRCLEIATDAGNQYAKSLEQGCRLHAAEQETAETPVIRPDLAAVKTSLDALIDRDRNTAPVPARKKVACPLCSGRGTVATGRGTDLAFLAAERRTCTRCNGTGKVLAR